MESLEKKYRANYRTESQMFCRGSRIWVVNTRLFQPPTTTRMSISVAVKQIVLFTM